MMEERRRIRLMDVQLKTQNVKWDNFPGEEFHYIDLSSVSREKLSIVDSVYVNSQNAPSRAKKVIRENDILFATTRPTLRRITIVPSKYHNQICSTGFSVIRPNKEIVSSRYIFYLLQSEAFISEMASRQRGASYPAVTDKDVLGFSFHPPPLPEQQRIVSILDKAFAAIDKAKAKAEQNLKNAKELFESYLQEVFEQNVHGEDGKELDEICELIVDCEHKTAPTQENGYPSIRTPNIGKGELILEDVNRVSYDTYIVWTRRAIPRGGDLILAREAPAGNIAIIPEDINVCLGQRTVLIRPKKDSINAKYLAYLILSSKVQKQLLSHSKGATVAHINMKDIRAFKIHNLDNLERQKIIANKLDKLFIYSKTLETKYQDKISVLEELMKSILQKAFTGELTTAKETVL